ncbi:hemerythrin domain-containing protein [Sphaerisporangium rubeum]|uniref:Hemerythrin superfamily protein n=1 Tax=Sphaerisporangium rubeum TaxID=321317 RepID=A0A7X0M437_9ACTN|nr:hemerythrin domain-containing protein [Sphaerisporangium rubeum]MBB6470717.1 hemerythrin superfamily protein [Sphaerisporangium rubeum]
MADSKTMPELLDENDVVGLLIRQHAMIRDLFAEVEQATGGARAEAFERLVRLLAVHETAEEEIVHPYARRTLDGGDEIVDERLREENEAKELLSLMEERGTDDPSFASHLEKLRKAVMEHARAEERYEFNQLVRETSDAERRTMALGVKAAEAIAPTHPHPGVESATMNIVVGTPTAIMDRARDVIRQAMSKAKSSTREKKEGGKGGKGSKKP